VGTQRPSPRRITPFQRKSCERKARFESEKDARRRAGRIRDRGGPDMTYYECSFCLGFHLSKKKDFEDRDPMLRHVEVVARPLELPEGSVSEGIVPVLGGSGTSSCCGSPISLERYSAPTGKGFVVFKCSACGSSLGVGKPGRAR
jgi:hypothetical protein